VKVLLVLFIFISSALQAGNKVTLGLLVFPPESRLDEITQECMGHYLDVSKKILAEYSIEIDVICAPPIRIYKLLENADIDFTINIKSTEALPDDLVFVETPFKTLYLDLYTHKKLPSIKGVAAIRGFSYHGYRRKMLADGYTFIDLPTSISAIQVFLKKRSRHLITYRSQVNFYAKEKKLNIKNTLSVLPLINVTNHYGISAQSPHLAKIKFALDDYAAKHHLQFFEQVTTTITASKPDPLVRKEIN
jgi:polar amino acid transport system substrate-binding protein